MSAPVARSAPAVPGGAKARDDSDPRAGAAVSGDLGEKDEPRTEPLKSYRTILQQEVSSADEEMRRPALALLLSGLTAGLDVGFGPMAMAVLSTTLRGAFPESVLRVLTANAYAIGFIFVVLGRSALFTEHTTSAMLPVLERRQSARDLVRLWALVLLGNTIGCFAFAFFASVLLPPLGAATPEAFGSMAHRLVNHSSWVIFLSAIMAGWIMGLVSWLVTAARDTVGQIICVWLATSVIGLAGLHHSVAGQVEVLIGVFLGQGAGVGDYLRFLVLAVPGNALGGTVFVALLKWGHIQQSRAADA